MKHLCAVHVCIIVHVVIVDDVLQALVSLAHVVADFVLLHSVEAGLEIKHDRCLLLLWFTLELVLACGIEFLFILICCGDLLDDYVEILKLLSVVLGVVDLIAFVVNLSLDYFMFFEEIQLPCWRK